MSDRVMPFEGIMSVERTNGNREFVTIKERKTGVILDQYWTERREKPSGRPPKRGPRNSFKKLYDANFDHLVDSCILNNAEFGFFSKLIRFLDWESNYLVHPQTGNNMTGSEIAKWLHMDKNDVLDFMVRLNEKGLVSIVKRGGNGYAHHYIFNVNIAFRGSKIKDLRQVDHFRGDCPFPAKKEIKYRQRDEDAIDEEE